MDKKLEMLSEEQLEEIELKISDIKKENGIEEMDLVWKIDEKGNIKLGKTFGSIDIIEFLYSPKVIVPGKENIIKFWEDYLNEGYGYEFQVFCFTDDEKVDISIENSYNVSNAYDFLVKHCDKKEFQDLKEIIEFKEMFFDDNVDVLWEFSGQLYKFYDEVYGKKELKLEETIKNHIEKILKTIKKEIRNLIDKNVLKTCL